MVGVFLRNILQVMEEIANPSWAFSWDNVGLQLGDENAGIKKILVSLDLSESVVSEAIGQDADLIISHHPLFFRPLTCLSFAEPDANLVRRLIKNDIAVYSAHTNLDKASPGTSSLLFRTLGLLAEEFLAEENPPSYYKKMVVFVPRERVEKVFQAIHHGGGGVIGSYSHCSFRSAGTGTYLPEAGADPYAGEVGKMEYANEIRLEAVVPKREMAAIAAEIRNVHPYEEVALDVYPLESTVSIGIGRVGNLPRPMKLVDWAREVKKRLGTNVLRLSGDPSAEISRVAVVAGSGGEFIGEAGKRGAQCLVTGDVRYHQARQAEALGMGLVDVGHYHSERLIVKYLVEQLSSNAELVENGIIIQGSESEQDPFIIVD